MIKIDNVTKLFQIGGSKKLKAVDDISLNIESGEIFGVIGYSGAGKSTLIRMLNGLEVPTEGTVTVSGREVSKIKALPISMFSHIRIYLVLTRVKTTTTYSSHLLIKL